MDYRIINYDSKEDLTMYARCIYVYVHVNCFRLQSSNFQFRNQIHVNIQMLLYSITPLYIFCCTWQGEIY